MSCHAHCRNYVCTMSLTHPQRISRRLGALAGTAVLGVVGLAACGSESVEPSSPDTSVSSPETSVMTKNKMLPTTTRVPVTLKMPTAPSGKINR